MSSSAPPPAAPEEQQQEQETLQEISTRPYGDTLGLVKWCSDRLGYGFITVIDGPMKGRDLFVHHSSIKPLNNRFKSLKKNEYVSFDILESESGLQAVGVTGVLGGPLQCDVAPMAPRQPRSDDPRFADDEPRATAPRPSRPPPAGPRLARRPAPAPAAPQRRSEDQNL